jgi:hypothetical protein
MYFNLSCNLINEYKFNYNIFNILIHNEIILIKVNKISFNG